MKVDILVATTHEVPRGHFELGTTKTRFTPGKRELTEKDWDFIYSGDENLADSFVAVGLIKMLNKLNKQMILFFNCEEDIPPTFNEI